MTTNLNTIELLEARILELKEEAQGIRHDIEDAEGDNDPEWNPTFDEVEDAIALRDQEKVEDEVWTIDTEDKECPYYELSVEMEIIKNLLEKLSNENYTTKEQIFRKKITAFQKKLGISDNGWALSSEVEEIQEAIHRKKIGDWREDWSKAYDLRIEILNFNRHSI